MDLRLLKIVIPLWYSSILEKKNKDHILCPCRLEPDGLVGSALLAVAQGFRVRFRQSAKRVELMKCFYSFSWVLGGSNCIRHD